PSVSSSSPFFSPSSPLPRAPPSFPTRRSSDLGLLAGAAACDEATRRHDLPGNPAALMALMWHHATGGKGRKDMVVLPYKDRLLLDRKSTRLNSSHSQISYAVFCLKKKKKNTQ